MFLVLVLAYNPFCCFYSEELGLGEGRIEEGEFVEPESEFGVPAVGDGVECSEVGYMARGEGFVGLEAFEEDGYKDFFE